MSSAPAMVPPGGAVALHADDVGAVAQFAAADKAASTRRGYKSDFALFSAWCQGRGYTAVPATSEVVAAFLSDQANAGIKPSTLSRRIAAIRYVHDLGGHPSPTAGRAVRSAMNGIRRTKGVKPRQKAPATAERIAAMLEQIPAESMKGKRDRALLLLGFAGAFRRSELVGLEVADLAFETEGLCVTIRKSKTDQEGQGHEMAIPRGKTLRPVRAVREWLRASGITAGPVFRAIDRHGRIREAALTPHSVALLVKEHAKAAGLDPAEFSGHSLRAGFLTSAAEAGADLFKMMEQSRHRRVETVHGYVRRANLFKSHAGGDFL